MLLFIIFCIPLKLLVKTEIIGQNIVLGIYLYGLRILNIVCDLSEKKIVINKKSIKLGKEIKKLSKAKKKHSSKFKLSPNIIKDLELRFFISRKENTDASDWAIQNAFYKALPENIKISLTKSENASINFSIYGFFTIFQIIFCIITNTKRR